MQVSVSEATQTAKHMRLMRPLNPKVCKNQEFFQLSSEQLANLLKSDDLNVTSEEEVFYSLMEWVQHDPTNREKDVSDLLSLIRLPLLAPVFIADHVETLCGSTECQQLVMEALKWHLLPERRSQMITTHRTRPRKSTMGRLLAVGGMDAHKGKSFTRKKICNCNYDSRHIDQ